MRRFEQTAAAPPLTTTPGDQSELTQILAWTVAAFVVVFVAVAGAWSAWLWDVREEVIRTALLVALLPVLAVAVLLAFASFRRILNAVEDLTGYDLDGNGAIGEDYRVIPVTVRSKATVNGVDRGDLVDFVRVIYQTHDWSQRTWRGKRLPSGRKVDDAYVASICGLLATAGILENYGPRKKARLAIDDLNIALAKLPQI